MMYSVVLLIVSFAIMLNVATSKFSQDSEKKLTITTSTGAYFEKYADILTYQQTIPMLYRYSLNLKSSEFFIREKFILPQETCERNTNTCISSKILDTYRKLFIDQIESNNALIQDFSNLSNRLIIKRDIPVIDPIRDFLGDWYAFCCRVLTYRDGQSLLSNQVSLDEKYRQLRKVVIEDHSSLLNISNNVEILSQNLEKFSSKIGEYIDKHGEILKLNIENNIISIRKTEYDILIMSYYETYSLHSRKLAYILNSCKNHRLSSLLVPKEELIESLIKLKKLLIFENLELTVPIENILNYYHLELINCNIANDILEVEIKVPVKEINAKYIVYQYQPLMFKSHDDKICAWDQNPAIIVHNLFDNKIREITGSDTHYCNKDKPLCYLPDYRGSDKISSCAEALFLEKSYNDVLTHCAFKCERNNGNLIMKQYDNNKFAIINAHELYMEDKSSKLRIKIEANLNAPGVTLLNVPCTIKILNLNKNNEIQLIIPTGFPCPKEGIKNITIEHHIPLLWTNFDFTVQNNLYDTFSLPLQKAYNMNWTKLIPNYTPIQSTDEISKRLSDVELEIPNLGYQGSHFTTHVIIMTWLTILTGLLINLMYKLMIRGASR